MPAPTEQQLLPLKKNYQTAHPRPPPSHGAWAADLTGIVGGSSKKNKKKMPPCTPGTRKRLFPMFMICFVHMFASVTPFLGG